MDEQQPENISVDTSAKNTRNVRSAIWYSLGALVVILLVTGTVWAYWSGYISIGEPAQNSIIPTPAAATSTVAWKTITSETPIRQVTFSPQYAADGYTYSYDFYDAGTFTGGPLAGDKLELGLNTYASPDSSGINGSYVYVVADKSGTSIGWWQDEDTAYPPELGLDQLPKLDRSLFPSQLLTYHVGDQTLTRPTADGPITAQAIIVYATADLHLKPVPGFQFDGDPIVRSAAAGQTGVFAEIQPYNYYVQLPTGVVFNALLTPLFMSVEGSVPNLTWSTGSTTVAAYNYDQYAYGLSDCFSNFTTFTQLQASFIQTGTTAQGDPVYEVDPTGNDPVYHCLYAKTQRYNYDPTTQASTSYYPTTYADFLGTHPVFFWKNATGDWVIFGRTDVVPAAEKAKPVIYLYPTKTEQVNVQVNPIGGFTKTDRAYGSGWNVSAAPSGRLTNLSDGETYPYLFWEGGASGVVNTPQEGFVVAQSDISALLTQKLALLGLNAQERADFLARSAPIPAIEQQISEKRQTQTR